jgi:radical SAM protein with 4Fe4S-binding SPASM domain
MACTYCYHADKKNLPFMMRKMPFKTASRILMQGAELGVHSVKTNWRGESTLNPRFHDITKLAYDLADGMTYLDRLTNSNFKFDTRREDIFKGLCYQTKVKVSYDSFNKEVFEKQRALGDHDLTTANIDKFYNYPGRDNEIVIQAVRTQNNKDEDFESEIAKRWPSAKLSVRDVVEGRLDKDIDDLLVKDRDASHRQSCLQAHVRLIFDWNGQATACCPDIRNEINLGNIHERTMYEIFNGYQAKALRHQLKNKSAFQFRDVCKNCSSHETYCGFKPSWDS